MIQSKMISALSWRVGVCCAALVATGAAAWIDPSPTEQAETQTAHDPASGLHVTQWRFSDHLAADPNQAPQGNIVPRRPLYLWITLDGTQAAVDIIRESGPLTVQVHWVRASENGAPGLVTNLTIGRPGLVDTLAQQVHRQGFFEWHSWARKDTLSPGAWTVSLAYPDGKLLPCGPDGNPCRLSINVG